MHAVESIAYAGVTPWHGLGVKVNPDLSPAEMMHAAGLNWTVSKRPLIYHEGLSQKVLRVPDKMALVRDSDSSVLAIVGRAYKPVQNHEAFDFFHKFVKAGQMEMHTAGSLWDGRFVWALAKLNRGFTLGKDDTVESFLLLMSPHVLGYALVVQFTPVRVVCWNTLNFALGSSLKGRGPAVRMMHRKVFDADVKAQAAESLGLAVAQTEEMQLASTMLAQRRASPDKVEEFMCELLKFDPRRARRKRNNSIREPRQLVLLRKALYDAPGQDRVSARGTWWGAVNAVTYLADHVTGRGRQTALRDAWLGRGAILKRRAFDLALRYAA
jgi:phage/plasmid-like protein (TIGR03299 family)